MAFSEFSYPQIAAFVCCCVGTPIWIFLVTFLYKHQHLIHYQKRGLELLWGSLIVIMLLFYYMNGFMLLHRTSPIYRRMWPFCMVIACITIEIFNIGRYCFIVANIQKQQELHEWKLHLNPEYRSKSFILKHINIFGNAMKLTIICYVVSILLLSLYVIGWILLPPESYRTYTIIIGIAGYSIFGSGQIYLVYFGHIFKFVDLWGISKQQILNGLGSIITVVYILVVIWINFEWNQIVTLSNVVCSIAILIAGIGTVFTPYKLHSN